MNIKLHRNPLFDVLIILCDIAAVFVSYLITRSVLNTILDAGELDVYLLALFTGLLLFMFFSYEMYTKVIRNKYELCLSVGLSVIVADAVVFVVKSIAHLPHVSDLYFLLMPVVLIVILMVSKLVVLVLVKKFEGVSKLLVIESKDVENNLARKVKYSYLDLYEAWYLMIDVNDQQEIDDLINRKFDDYASIFISPSIPDTLRDLLISRAVSKGMGIYILPDLYNINVMNSEVVQFDDTPALRISAYGLTKLERVFKRMFDILVASIAILITSPVMLVCAAAIKLDSKGPVIYKQERLTIHQKPFYIRKFRTMRNDAEKETGAVLSVNNDPRITRVGKVLRQFRLDELPQFFNILSGSMSIVGPRPERPEFIRQFLQDIPNYDKRFFAKAGLTGLAQVYAKYETTPKDKLLFDILYIRDYSFWLDIKLVLLTLKIIFIKESSDGVKPIPDYSKQAETAANHPTNTGVSS